MVNIVVEGVEEERVAFFFSGCSSVKVENLGFGLSNTQTSHGGTTYLPTENWYPLALEGNVGVEVVGCKFVTPRTAVFADAYHGAANRNINVHDNEFGGVANYSILARNADGVRFAGNHCEGTGRSWHTFGEDVALSDGTANAVVEGNRFINPLGVQSRITPTRNVGPTTISANVKTGGGRFVEICDASNITITGNASTSTDLTEHVLFTSEINANNEHVTIAGNVFVNGGHCVGDYYAGGRLKDGLVFANNVCSNTFGPQAWNSRAGVIFEGNRFDLSSAGREIRVGGYGLVFKGNSIRNGYVSLVDNGAAIVEGNFFLGSATSPVPYALNVSGTVGHQVRGNWIEPGSYLSYINQSPALPVGFRYLDAGVDASPDVAFAGKIRCNVGDTIENGVPVELGAILEKYVITGWKCTRAGTPGTWLPLRALTGH
ncbi:MAG: hypothetical protein QM767_14440 [Anaeromyxobacter sp.]